MPTIPKIQLNPCPKCGGEALLVKGEKNDCDTAFVRCSSCGTHTATWYNISEIRDHEVAYSAIADWNNSILEGNR